MGGDESEERESLAISVNDANYFRTLQRGMMNLYVGQCRPLCDLPLQVEYDFDVIRS